MVTLLGPATVALAVLIGIAAGAASTVLVALALALALGVGLMLDPAVLLSMSVKSVTAPVALELVRSIDGNPTLATGFVIVTGIIGTVLGPWLMDRAGIHHPLARGLALGIVSHGQGTAQALAEGEQQGAIAGISMGAAAVATSIALPWLQRLLFLPL